MKPKLTLKRLIYNLYRPLWYMVPSLMWLKGISPWHVLGVIAALFWFYGLRGESVTLLWIGTGIIFLGLITSWYQEVNPLKTSEMYLQEMGRYVRNEDERKWRRFRMVALGIVIVLAMIEVVVNGFY